MQSSNSVGAQKFFTRKPPDPILVTYIFKHNLLALILEHQWLASNMLPV